MQRYAITLHDKDGNQLGNVRPRYGTLESVEAEAARLVRNHNNKARRDVAGNPSTKATSYRINPR